MKGRRLLALSVLTITLACQDSGAPTEPKGLAAPTGPVGLISDGAHGGNPDFFFLPPMVPNPVGDQNYDAGKGNDALQRSLTVEICLLQAPPVNAQGQPVATDCVAGPPVKKFPAGTVQLQGAPDGHYQVQWKTRESNLDITKYYRIKVLIEGLATPLGIADVDPMENKSQLKNARTGEVIALIDDSTLPIKFRVEKGGGTTLCGGAVLCSSGTITNTTPNGEPQFVRVPAPDGSFIAGVLIPSGFLPADGPQTVVLTIAGVNTGANNVSTGTQANPCHANLALQQFNSCFHFRTYPELEVIEGNQEGHQFLQPITVAVCFVLADAEDPRVPFVQLWSSDPDVEGGDTKPLPSASAALILSGPSGQTCGDVLVADNGNSNRLTRFASAGWQKVKSGFNRVFGVQTAYAVDVGIGGLAFDLSDIGPALTAQIQRYTDTDLTLGPGATTTSTARIVGTRVHNGTPLTTGIGGLPVTFTVAAGNGSLRLIGSELPGASVLTSITNTNPINPESPTSGGGFAPVNWTLPTEAGTYTLSANGPALGGPVTFTATVAVALPNPIIQFAGSEVFSVNETEFIRYNLPVTNFAAYPAAMFTPAPTLPACGGNTQASRTWVDVYNAANDFRIYGFCAFGSPSDLQSVWFGLPVSVNPPAQVYVTLVDRATDVTYMSNTVALTKYQSWLGSGSIESTGRVQFGGPPFCVYTVELTNVQGSLQLNTSGGGSGNISATNTERLATPPCGNIQPAPEHLDQYVTTAVVRTGNGVVAVFAPFNNPIAANVQLVGTLSADQQTLTGTLTWQRIDQLAPLDWRIVAPITLTVNNIP